MKILKNKYFILGNIALLLAVIPLTLFFISRQQDVRSRAAPTTKIIFSPTTLSFQGEECSEQSLTVKLDPGENIVATVELFLTYDATKVNISISPNENVFPEILRGPTISNGQASVVMNIGSSVTKAIQSPTDIATITVVPVAATTEGPVNISIDSSKTRVFSLSESDEATENVFLSGGQSAVSVDAICLDGDSSPSPTVSIAPSISPSISPSAAPSVSPPVSPSISQPPSSPVEQLPVCSTISASPSTTGTAPFVLTLNAQGSDSDGTITKATFDFGDNVVQDVTEGLGAGTVTTQLSHTYQTAGNYSASVVFTDNSGAVSNSCTTNITVQPEAITATAAPTAASGEGIQPTATFTPTPPIENPGGVGTTIAVIGGLLLVILGGLALIAL